MSAAWQKTNQGVKLHFSIRKRGRERGRKRSASSEREKKQRILLKRERVTRERDASSKSVVLKCQTDALLEEEKKGGNHGPLRKNHDCRIIGTVTNKGKGRGKGAPRRGNEHPP